MSFMQQPHKVLSLSYLDVLRRLTGVKQMDLVMPQASLWFTDGCF